MAIIALVATTAQAQELTREGCAALSDAVKGIAQARDAGVPKQKLVEYLAKRPAKNETDRTTHQLLQQLVSTVYASQNTPGQTWDASYQYCVNHMSQP